MHSLPYRDPAARGLPDSQKPAHREQQANGGPHLSPPRHLQLGPTTAEVPEAKFDLQPSLTKSQQKFMAEIKKEFCSGGQNDDFRPLT
jgi:hypothetical protein